MALTKVRTSEDITFDSNIALGGSYKITGALDPTDNKDYATKQYVDSIAQGIKVRSSVRVASTANISALSGVKEIDGVALGVKDRVLVKNQNTWEQNGIYIVETGAWTRALDADEWGKLVSAFFFVEEGASQCDTGWVCTVDEGGALGVDDVKFEQFSKSGDYNAGNGLFLDGLTFGVDLDTTAPGLDFNSGKLRVKLDGTTLSKSSDGLKVNLITASNLASSIAGDGLQGGAGSALSVKTGDGLEINSGALRVVSAVMRKTDFIVREVPSGTINGSNVEFTLSKAPISGKEMIFKRGLLMNAGAGNDYTISGSTITFTSAPKSGDSILAVYF